MFSCIATLRGDPIRGQSLRGRPFATCPIQIERSGEPQRATPGTLVQLTVHRPAAVDLILIALPGDRLEMLAAEQSGNLLIPASHGHLEVLLGPAGAWG